MSLLGVLSTNPNKLKKTLDEDLNSLQDNSSSHILFDLEMCFHHPKPLKTTSVQSNHIKKNYKTHTCHGLIAT